MCVCNFISRHIYNALLYCTLYKQQQQFNQTYFSVLYFFFFLYYYFAPIICFTLFSAVQCTFLWLYFFHGIGSAKSAIYINIYCMEIQKCVIPLDILLHRNIIKKHPTVELKGIANTLFIYLYIFYCRVVLKKFY